MTKYDIIYESLQEQVDAGILALEDAEILNDLAYEKYINEASRLTKEYNKKQNEYRDTVKKADADSEKQKHKIEKYKRALGNDIYFGNKSVTNNTILRGIEKADDKLMENEKDKKRAKYASKSRGLNRDMIYGTLNNSKKIGKDAAKRIALNKEQKMLWDKEYKKAKYDGDLKKLKLLKDNKPSDSKIDEANHKTIKSAKEYGENAKKKQTVYKDQSGKHHEFVKDDLLFRTDKKHKNNAIEFQKELKFIDKGIDLDKKYGKYSPTGGSERGNIMNFHSEQKTKELQDKFKKAKETFVRVLDTKLAHDKYIKNTTNKAEIRDKEIKKFTEDWWTKHN